MNFLKRLFGKKHKQKEWSDEELEKFYLEKGAALEKALGKQEPIVGHAVIPFRAGGAVDMYYYHHGDKGTIFAT